MALIGVLTVLALSSPASADETLGVSPSNLPYAVDHVLVELEPAAAATVVLEGESGTIAGDWHRVVVPEGMTASQLVEDLRLRDGVKHAEFDFLVQLDPALVSLPVSNAELVEADDPLHALQWHFPAIQIEAAWGESTGAGVVVAVIDTGVSQGGDDLRCHTFVSPYNAIRNVSGLAATEDDHGHGTHVAGTVGQCTDNGVGVAGVAFDASLMPVKVLGASGSGLLSDVAEGIAWAHHHGADIINLSFGCTGCSSSLLNEAIESASDDGILVVAASGNDNATKVSFPASHPDVVAVGAVGYGNFRAPYSNSGSALDLVAPGGDLSKDGNGDGEPDGVLQETFQRIGTGKDFGFFWFQGTSMATPHVSGAAALLLSRYPGISPAQVRNALESTALDLGSAGHDGRYGHGLIQVHDAVRFDFTPPLWGTSTAEVAAYGETFLSVTWGNATDNNGVTGYEWRLGGITGATGSSRKAIIAGLQPGLAYTLEVVARDGSGNWSNPLRTTVRTARAFSDTPGHTFYEDILWMSGSDITRGCNPPANDLYCPDEPVSRGQMAAFLDRALGLAASPGDWFDDDAGSTFEADINALAYSGITLGCNPPANDRFCPDDAVTRAQMAGFLVRALGLKTNSHPGFGDVPMSSNFAHDIGRLATAGITMGCNPPANDRFCPNDPITRGELAAFFRRALD